MTKIRATCFNSIKKLRFKTRGKYVIRFKKPKNQKRELDTDSKKNL